MSYYDNLTLRGKKRRWTILLWVLQINLGLILLELKFPYKIKSKTWEEIEKDNLEVMKMFDELFKKRVKAKPKKKAAKKATKK